MVVVVNLIAQLHSKMGYLLNCKPYVKCCAVVVDHNPPQWLRHRGCLGFKVQQPIITPITTILGRNDG